MLQSQCLAANSRQERESASLARELKTEVFPSVIMQGSNLYMCDNFLSLERCIRMERRGEYIFQHHSLRQPYRLVLLWIPQVCFEPTRVSVPVRCHKAEAA